MLNLDSIRVLLLTTSLEILAFFHPIGQEIYILLMIFICNFFCGLIADKVNNNKFEIKKVWKCIFELTTFFGLSVFIFQFGQLKGWNVGALQCVSFLTYVVFWFYSLNSLRNLKSVFKKHTPAYNVISFLHYLLSIEFVKYIPHLNEWLNISDEDKESEDEK